MGWRERVVERLFGDVMEARVREAVKVVDNKWWDQVAGGKGTQDQYWWELRSDMEDALEAWRRNPLAFRVVALTTDYVVGSGIRVSSPIQYVNGFAQSFWEHRQNQMGMRVYSWCDELTRSGELFVVLFTNPADGMTYVRTIPAVKVNEIETDPDDLERELRYHELRQDDPITGKWWDGWERSKDDLETPVVLHYAINRGVGCVRGQSDLASVLPWLRRYREWLEDRVRVNRYKNAFLWHVKLTGAQAGDVLQKQAQYASPPSPGSVIVTDETEEWTPVQPKIEAEDVKDDGRALRLMIAVGAGVPLHYLAEGESATRATAREMAGPTVRHYEHRQLFFCDVLVDVIEKAAYRAQLAGLLSTPRGGDLRLVATVSDLREEDNLQTAQAAGEIVKALTELKEQGWITDRKAMEMAFRFAGEQVDIDTMLAEIEALKVEGGSDDVKV